MTHATGDAEKRHDTLSPVTGKSGRGTARQTIRVDEALWEKFGAAAESLDKDRSAVLRDFMRWFTWERGAKRPDRPKPQPVHGSSTEEETRG